MKKVIWVAGMMIMLFAVLISYDLGLDLISGESDEEVNAASIVDEVVFPHDEVVDVYITIDEEDWNYMTDNAMEEEMVIADITYNGYEFQDVGIRPKGNSSLRDVANSDSDRYSFKIDFNEYISGQNFLGLTKLNLNNLFMDPTMMAEYIGYEALDSIDADASRTTYVALYINDEYYGLYLSVEQVNESFLEDHYDESDGALYKPDMGTGSDLAYISDDPDDYAGLFSETTVNDNKASMIELIETINQGGDLDEVLNVDSFLSYLALSSLTIHNDSYQGGMFHNYYLYDNDGVFEWISWDLNMIFNGFPSGTDADAMAYLIDEPTSGEISGYSLVEAVMANDDYVEVYHDYLELLMESYFEASTFENRVLEIYDMIAPYVQIDPTAFYTYDEFEAALFEDVSDSLGLLNYMTTRSENVSKQLSGEIPSTNNGAGNAGGRQGMAGKGMDSDMQGGIAGERGQGKQRPGMNQDTTAPADQEGTTDDNMADSDRPERGMTDGAEPSEAIPQIDFESLLPEGMTMEDVPESIRTAIEAGEVPPMEEVRAFMEENGIDPMMPATDEVSMGQQGMNNTGGRADEVVNEVVEVVDMQATMINAGVGLAGVLSLIFLSFFMSRKY